MDLKITRLVVKAFTIDDVTGVSAAPNDPGNAMAWNIANYKLQILTKDMTTAQNMNVRITDSLGRQVMA